MLHGVDDRKQSWQAQNLFADAVGADQTMFSTNGSTTSVHTALATVVNPGEKLLIARNGHKSQVTGLSTHGTHHRQHSRSRAERTCHL
jgi:arginine decarboxylase